MSHMCQSDTRHLIGLHRFANENFNDTSWYLRNELLKHSGHWLSSSWLAPKGAVLFNWLYSPRRNLRLFTWSFSRWYLNEPPREKVFPQHLTSPGHFVSSTTYFLQPSSFFFSPPMTCLFLAEGFSNLSTVLKNWSFRSSAPTSSPIVATSSPLPSAWHGMVHLARFAELSLSIWSNAKL